MGLASTGRCPLPAPVAAAIRAGGELGPLVDALLDEENTKQRGGASAAFTAGHAGGGVASLAAGVVYACAPFLTPAYFGPQAMGQAADLLCAAAAAPDGRSRRTRPMEAKFSVALARCLL